VKTIVLLLSVLLLAGCAVDQPAAPATTAPTLEADIPTDTGPTEESEAGAATEIADISPWAPEGLTAGYTVTGEVNGSCWVGALTAARTDAWRCSAPLDDVDQILDPCLANPYDGDSPLACVDTAGNVILLSLTEPLPQAFANPPDSETLPISLTLDNGKECNLATGATTTVDLGQGPERVNYFCGSGGALIGVPNRDGAIWTVKYAADPGLLTDYQTLGIARAAVFRGDTGTVGWNSPGDLAGALSDVTVEERPGGYRVTFEFSGETLPDYEIGYTNEPIVDGDGNPVPLEGEQQLRLWFRYPRPETPPATAAARVSPARDTFLNEALVARAQDGSLILYLGLDGPVGFRATRNEDDTVLFLDLYEPDFSVADLPVLGVGSKGAAVLALQERLVELGYLAALPDEPKYDEPTRQAVVALQQARGLIPDGVAGPAVWAALARPVPPERAGSSARFMTTARLAPAQQGAVQVTPAGPDPINVRNGPGLDYDPVGLLMPGEAAPVISRIDTGDPVTSWWEIRCCEGQTGWVRADVVNLAGSSLDVMQSADPGRSPNSSQGIRPDTRPLETTDGNPILYFTFDDGPLTPETEAVVAVLDANNARATFFNIGQQVTWSPEVPAAVSEGGHSVQNHTYDHQSLENAGHDVFYREVEQTQIAIQQATGILPTCLRPPYGATDPTTFQMAEELGLDIALWTIDTQDWRRPGTEAIVEHILDSVVPGAIILMHDGGGERSQTIAALEQVLPQLAAQGYVFERLCR
jgi:peptidoglycan/xylan/chitin deacetylase (PgdA/CDA1 family)